jgi:phage replication O-like protein O
MANPQLEAGHCDIANELMDAIIKTHFSPTEVKVLMAIIRKTYGWHKKTDRISYSQFEEITAISRRHIAPALQSLIRRNIINRTGDGYNLEYGIQKDYELWLSPLKIVTETGNEIVTSISNESLPEQVMIDDTESLPVSPKSLPVSPKSLPVSPKIVTESVPTKDTIQKPLTKTIIQKQYSIPGFINLETWQAFENMRKSIKEPLSDDAAIRILKKLERLKSSGDDPNEILDESIMNNWKGVFALKKNGGQNGINRGNTQTNPIGQSRTERLKASARIGTE